MKNKLVLLLIAFATAPLISAAPPPTPVRTIKDLRGFPMKAARTMLPNQLFRSISISPIESWVVARCRIYSSKPAATTIIHEEGGGAYDKLILAIADQYRSTGDEQTESRIAGDSLTFNLVVFDIKDGTMGVLIPHTDDDRYEGFEEYGDAWIGIYKDGKWRQVNKPTHATSR